ncbi:MAG TPA: sulfur oxidation c-type cytochrome SoxX [Pseudolabrys sp.]|nr:sulfur oxidation c-type cytochrome SoxX [Pseudolabrys sp.]
MRMKALIVAVAALSAAPALAQDKPSSARLDAMIKAAFPGAPADWQSRFVGDETMKECSDAHNTPAKATDEAIEKRERAKIKYPADGKLMGDWKAGEKLAQSGYGFRFTDYPPKQANGGNCYACHQLTKAEVSYGTVGPSLLGYGKQRKFAEADVKAVYEKIYDSNAVLACSVMPRFGANGVLTIDEIKDLVALLMSPDSPVNK